MATFDDFTDDADERLRKEQANMALRFGVEANPEQAAHHSLLAKRYGLPLAVVQSSPDEFSTRAKFEDAKALLAESAKLQEWLAADPKNAAIAHDDVDNLVALERTLKGTLGDVGTVALKGAMGLPQAFVGLADIPTFGRFGKLLDSAGVRFNEAQKIADTFYSPAQQAANSRVHQAKGFFETLGAALSNPSVIATNVGESVPQMLGGATIARGVLGIGGPVVAGAIGEGVIGAGSAAEQIRGETSGGVLSPKQVAAAIASGAGTGGFALLGGKLAQKLGIADIDTALASGQLTQQTVKQGLVKSLVEGGISEGVLEELPQSAQEQVWQNFATDRPLMEGVANAAAMGLLAGASMGGGFQGVQYAAARKGAQAQRTAQMGETLAQFNDLASASKVRGRDVESAQGYFQSLMDEGRSEVYITPDALMQSGLAQQIAQAIPDVAEQLQSAALTGHDIRIPIAPLMANFAGPELAQSVIPHLADEPGGFTPTTANEYMQSGAAKELEAEIERTLADKQGDDTFKQSTEAVRNEIKAQLDTAARFTPQVNDAYSAMVSNFFAVTAAKLGTTPEELYKRYPLRVGAESVGGGRQFEQGGISHTDTPEFKAWFGGSKVVDADGRPLVMHHWSDNEFTTFDMNASGEGAHFGTKKAATDRARGMADISYDIEQEDGQYFVVADSGPMADEWQGPFTTKKEAISFRAQQPKKIDPMALYLSIKNPVRLPDLGTWSAWDIVRALPDGTLSATEKAAIMDADDRYTKLRETLLGKGIDGIVYRNEVEDKGKDSYIAFDPTQIKSAIGNRGTFDPNDPNILHQSAFHGSPYKFDKFSLDHMGKGEGAQAYGWGLYFAGNKQVAEYYRKTLSGDGSSKFMVDGQKHSVLTDVQRAQYESGGKEKAIAKQKEWITKLDEIDKNSIPAAEALLNKLESSPEYAIRALSSAEMRGQLYEVNIPEDDTYLLWDKPLSEQPEKVKAALKAAGFEEPGKAEEAFAKRYAAASKKLGGDAKAVKAAILSLVRNRNMSDADWATLLQGNPQPEGFDLNAIHDDYRPQYWESFYNRTTGEHLYRAAGITGESAYKKLTDDKGSDEAASKYLHSLGIQGIKYLDGSSRDNGEGHHNYVIFDDKAIEILNTFYQTKGTNRGAFNPASLSITLLKNADLSTFLHESGHFFLEVQADIVGRLQQEAAQNGIESLKPGERQMIADMDAVLKWFGVRDLTEWGNLDFEEKRHHHEQFARGFEAYLFDGTAPSIELQGVFQRFRAWLLNVYKELKALNVELTDEVRGVFDRMLASGEQITLAEQGRSMMPLFTSPEQAGMTPEEFAAYQALGVDATNEAIQNLQARGLRDMQWIHNARGRVIKQLQKEAKAQRAEVRMGVRNEVMGQPIYRAWQFLTGKLAPDDKIAPATPPKSDPNVVDETRDSLFAAIAKMGGLSKDAVIAEWGTDPKDKPASGVFGKPVWRRDGGLSPDAMVEALAQYGYLETDKHGKADLHELEEKFAAELRGETQYSFAHNPNNEMRAGDQVANPDALGAGRLDLGELNMMGLPDEVVNVLKAHRMTSNNGLHPDLVADMFGFTSGDELVRKLAATDPPREEIEGITDQRMLEQFGDLSSPEAIERAADKAIHNDVRARMIATETNALDKATGKPKVLASAAKAFAAATIARLKVRNIKPSQYASAEARAAKAALEASKAGDLATAAAEKRNQLVNTYATRAAYDAQEEVEGLRRKWSELANRADDKLVRAYDMDLINAVRAILGQYGIAESKSKRAGEYLKTLQDNDPEMFAIVSASVEAAERNAMPFKEMTVEGVRGLADEIDAILHLARRSRQMEVDGDLLDRQEIEADLRARMEEIGVPDTVPGEGQAMTKGEERMLKFKTLLAAATRVESWVGKMDGAAPMGVFRRYLWNRIKDSSDAYRSDKAKHLRAFRGLLDSIAPTLKPGVLAAPEIGYTFGKDSGGSAINEIVHAILHTGNESNRRKLLLGRNWAKENPDGTLDTSRWDAFIARMAAEGRITKAHFDFAQGVWDLLDSMKPLAQKTHRDVFGKYFDEVTASPLQTPFGTYAGGYVPAMVDSRVVTDAKLRTLSEQENSGMSYAFPTTPKGFTKGRVEYNKPLLLDLRTLAQHIDKVLLFSHMEMPVRDVQRVLRKVGGTLDRIDPAAIGMLTPWLNRAARQQVVTPISADGGLSRFLSTLRSRAGAAAMFGNIANAAQQITGFSLAAVKVKPALLLSATADYVKHPRKFAEAVAEASPYMRERLDAEVAAMNDDINAILLNPSLLEKGQAWSMRHAYFLQSAVDSVMSPIVWTAAYNQAVEQGLEHKDAVRLGDSAVRETQGSSLPEDISRAESGNAFVRLFTQFAWYFNMQANLLGTEFGKVMRDYGLRKGAGRGMYVFLFGFLVPAIVGELVIQLFRGGPGDDDKDGEYLDDWLAALFGWAPLRNVTAMIPVAGTIVNASVNAWNSKPYDDRIATSPAVSMLEAAAKAPVSVWDASVNDGSKQKAVRDVATLISMTLGLPANLAARPIGYLTGVADDRIAPTSTADAVRGVVTGAASPESKHP